MTMRTIRTMVTFKHPFMLSALETRQLPGTYAVETDEEQIDGLSFLAYRRIATSLHLPAIGMQKGFEQVVRVDPGELELALKLDIEATDL